MAAVSLVALASAQPASAAFGVVPTDAPSNSSGGGPYAVAVAPDGSVGYMIASGRLVTYTPGQTQVREVTLEAPPAEGFHSWSGLAIDDIGNVYVADADGGRVEEFDPSGTLLRSIGSPGSALGELQKPVDVALGDGGSVFVAELGTDRISEFDATGTLIRVLGGPGSAPGELSDPKRIAIAGDYIYVADSGNHRIQELTTGGAFVRAWGSEGEGPEQFGVISGLAVGADASVYVADLGAYRDYSYPDSRIKVFTADGQFTGSFGCGVRGTRGSLEGLTDIAADSAGNVYSSQIVVSGDKIPFFYVGKITRFGDPGEAIGCKPIDTRAPEHQRLRHLRLRVGCPGEPCDVSITGTVVVGKRRVELQSNQLSLAADQDEVIRLRLTKPQVIPALEAMLDRSSVRRRHVYVLVNAAPDATNNYATRNVDFYLRAPRH